MNLLFTSIYKHLIKNRMFWCILLFAITIGLCYLASTISLREDIMEFLPKNKQNKDVSFVINNMKSQNKIVFAIYAKNDTLPLSLDETIVIAEALVTTLNTIGNAFIDNVLYYIDQSQITATSTFVSQNIPLFFDSLALANLDQLNASQSNAAITHENH